MFGVSVVLNQFLCVWMRVWGPGLAGEAGESLEIEVANVNLYC